MVKQSDFLILSNEKVVAGVYKMVLSGDTSAITTAGQFVNLALDGLYLRRPISVCDLDKDKLTLIYKVVGKGTEQMASLLAGSSLNLLTGLGNGYDLSLSGDHPLVIGGGVGIPPLYLLVKRLLEQGKQPTAILGFNQAEEVFYREEFEKLCPTYLTTVDGSAGIKGFVTNALPLCGGYSYFYTCGPLPMLKAVYDASKTSGQFSFEERMGCGFGACMGCSCKTKYKNKRICKDGPVLMKEEIVW
jgi:dihydroorotate dehydrogenase electron transfer subunit